MTRPMTMPGLTAMILVAASVVGVACNATAATSIPTRTMPPPSASVTAGQAITTPADLRGTWTANVQGTTASSGTWKLVISESNLSLQNPVGGDPFTLDPTSMTETSLTLPAADDCPDQAVITPGTYTVALINNQLVITLVGDSCGDRSGTLASVPWTRAP